jgi:rhodanese-related sulfurtransferase
VSEAVDPQRAAELIEARAVDVLDVREPDEFAAGHIAGGTNIPLGALSEQAAALDRDRTLLVHCQTGPRQTMAATALEAAGYDVRLLSGGFEAWRAAGLPIEGSEKT